MARLVQFDFPFEGPFGAAMSEALAELANSINDEPGFLWKIWTENESEATAGGIYLFEDDASAQAYIAKHSERLAHFGITGIRAKTFDVNAGLTAINRGPVA